MARRAVENVVDTIQGKLMSAINKVTLEPINDGFKEYELKMGSIQTIMASTGEDLKTVKGYLEELNAYSDKTIYSFSDMTNNIGKFTNAGVKLEDAVNAIKGVANEAAVSGANANEASRAMYNFAQALSSGYVKLIDWKSIENANMATVGFKEALLETAVAMKTVKKNGDGMYEVLTTDANGKTMKDAISATKNFNDSLSHQWMTTEVLTQTLKQYATDVRTLTKDEKKQYEEELKKLGYTEAQIKNIEHLGMKASDAATEVKTWTMMVESLMEAIGSGWATTFELIFGDFEQAKKMWTSINNVLSGIVDSASTARNNFLKGVLGNNLGKFEWQHLTQLGATTKEVREKLKELASKGGWDLDALIDKYGTFEDTLQAGWLSAEMFGDAIEATNGKIKKDSHDLTEYGKAIEQSALFAAKGERRFQNLVDAGYSLNTIYGLIKAQVRGYDISQGELTEEQIKAITTVEAEREALRKLSDTAGDADMSLLEVSDTLHSFTSGLYDSRFSGRDAALATLGNSFKMIGQILTSVKDAIGDVFTMVSPEYLNDQLLYIYELSEGLELTEEQMHAIRSMAGKLLRPLKELTDAFGKLTQKAVIPVVYELLGAGFDLLKGTFYVPFFFYML
jgi:tape measure domain-containing protein